MHEPQIELQEPVVHVNDTRMTPALPSELALQWWVVVRKRGNIAAISAMRQCCGDLSDNVVTVSGRENASYSAIDHLEHSHGLQETHRHRLVQSLCV